MLDYLIPLCLVLLGAALVLNLARLFMGPDLPDRILALDTLYINALALIVVFGIWRHSELFFEIALLIAVMGFVSTAAICKHLLHGDIID